MNRIKRLVAYPLFLIPALFAPASLFPQIVPLIETPAHTLYAFKYPGEMVATADQSSTSGPCDADQSDLRGSAHGPAARQ
jgi:hypothetical protein